MRIEIPINDPNFVNVDLLPPGGMHFYLLPDGKNFVVTQDHEIETSLGIAVIPTGFITDLASIPEAFQSFISPLDKHFPAAVLHDLWYRVPWTRKVGETIITREIADEMFLEEMEDLEVDFLERRAMYRAVRIGGSSSWVEPKPTEGEG